MSEPLQATKRSPGVQFDFRPEYWDADGLLTAPWANIKGQLRKHRIKQIVESGEETDLLPSDFEETLTREHRKALAAVHPSLMGGEYLPDLLPGEIEIARTVMQSVMLDVTSMRARPDGRVIRYRIVDDYWDDPGMPDHSLPFETSRLPLTLRRLIQLIDGTAYGDICTGLFDGFLTWSVDGGADPDSYRDFIQAESDFYPELRQYYAWRTERWYDRTMRDM